MSYMIFIAVFGLNSSFLSFYVEGKNKLLGSGISWVEKSPKLAISMFFAQLRLDGDARAHQ